MLRSFLMTYLDLITQQAGAGGAIYLGGDSPDEAPITMNSTLPVTKYGTYFTDEGLGEGASWRHGSSWTLWGNASSPGGVVSYSAWVYFPSGALVRSPLGNRGATSTPSVTSGQRIELHPPDPNNPDRITGGLQAGGGTIYRNVGFENDTWHHVVVAEGTGIYVDGNRIATRSTNTNLRMVLLGNHVVAGINAEPDETAMRLDHFAAFNRTLTEDEILEQFNYPGFQAVDEVEINAEPAAADAEMLDAEFSNIGHAKINAAPMHAEARSGYHEVWGDRTAYTRRVLAPWAWRYSSGWVGSSDRWWVPRSSTAAFAVQVPDGRIEPTDNVSGRTVRIARIQGSGGHGGAVYAATRSGNGFSYGRLLSSNLSGGVISLAVPMDVEYLIFEISNSGTSDAYWDNPREDITSDASYFTISAAPAPVTRVPAPTAHASALAIDPALDITANILRYVPATVVSAEAFTPGVSVQTAADIAMQTTPANAEGFMPNPTMPNVGVYPDVALGTAAMNATWFSSEVRVNAAYAEADGEALDIEGVTAGRNIIAGVAAANTRATIREPWLSINDVEVDRNTFDPYWQRVARRSTEGYLPPAVERWYRLNQREGNFVQRLDRTGVFVSRPPAGYINGYDIEGDFEWGAAGPNGKRGMAVREAAFGFDGQGTYFEYDPGQTSLEFTVRLDPGHTGRMEVARGADRPWHGYPGGDRGFNVSIRDGKVYFYGHSFSRIDDGEWHHVVVTTTSETAQDYHAEGFIGKTQINLAIYIDGKLDRFLTSIDNMGSYVGFSPRAQPSRFLGGDTEYPFKGEILDIVTRKTGLLSHEVQELYLDMFGYKAIRAGSAMAVAADMGQKSKVVSNMRRMLVVSWETPDDRMGVSPWNDDDLWIRSIPTKNGQLSPMLGYGWDEEMDVGRYLMTTVYVDRIWTSKESPAGPLKPGVLDRPIPQPCFGSVPPASMAPPVTPWNL